MTNGDVIVLMQTVHLHMLMESILEKEGISFQTRIKPRQLGTDCGMALEVDFDDIDRIKTIAERKNILIFGFFTRCNDNWKQYIPD